MNLSKHDTKAMKGIAILLMVFHHLFAFPNRVSVEYVTMAGLDKVEFHLA